MQNLFLYKLKAGLRYLKTFDINKNKVEKLTYSLFLNELIILQLSPIIHNVENEVMDSYGNMITEKVSVIKVLVENSIYNVFLEDLNVV